MPLLRGLTDTDGITISRQTGHESLGNRFHKPIYRDLSANVRVNRELIRDEATRENREVILVRFRFPARDALGYTLDIQQGDSVIFPDYQGDEQVVHVINVVPVRLFKQVDHFRVEASG